MKNVQLFDVSGRLLVEKKEINQSETTINAGTTNQVITIKITSDQNATVIKKVVN